MKLSVAALIQLSRMLMLSRRLMAVAPPPPTTTLPSLTSLSLCHKLIFFFSLLCDPLLSLFYFYQLPSLLSFCHFSSPLLSFPSFVCCF